MADSRTQVAVPPGADALEPRVRDVLKSALSKELSASVDRGGAQFGDCSDARFSDIGPFGDISV
jgi:hypothetical protein